MIDYRKVLSREKLECVRDRADDRLDDPDGRWWREAALSLLDHAKVFDMTLQHLTPMGSEYVNDPRRCSDHVREARQGQHNLIVKQTMRANAAEDELSRLRAALTFINTLAGTAEEGEVKALNDICRASYDALNPS